MTATKRNNPFAMKISFALGVCNRLRFCVGRANKSITARKKAFEVRDTLETRIHEAAGEKAKTELKAQCYDVEHKIDALNAEVKFYNSTIRETIENADDGKFEFAHDETPLPSDEAEDDPDDDGDEVVS